MSEAIHHTPAELQAELDVNHLRGYMDEIPGGEEVYGSVFLSVHYGYTEEFLDYAFESDGWADWRNYEDYQKSFEETIRETNPDIVVALLTDRLEDAGKELLCPLLEDYSHAWLYTGERLPLLKSESMEELAGIIASLEDGAEVVVSGESDDKCVDYQMTFLDHLQRNSGRSFSVEKGPTFPSASMNYEEWRKAREA